MIENENLYSKISSYISPDDFTGELNRRVAKLLYEQHEKGELNPAKLLNHFTSEEEHREAASLFSYENPPTENKRRTGSGVERYNF